MVLRAARAYAMRSIAFADRSTPMAAAIAAGVAALEDHDHIEKAIAHNDDMACLARPGNFRELGIKVTPSVGNFLLLHFNGETQARAADRFLSEPRLDPARGRRLWLAAVPAAHGRHRGSKPSCRRDPQGFRHVSRAARVPDGLGAPLSEPLFQRLALIGMGLIGSSLARVCRRKGLAREIAAADRSADGPRDGRRNSGSPIEVFETAAAAVAGADLVILCAPARRDGNDRAGDMRPISCTGHDFVRCRFGQSLDHQGCRAASAGQRAFCPGASRGGNRAIGSDAPGLRRFFSIAGAY